MTIEQMLAAQRERVSFHMPGHKMRRGAETEFDTTELPNTDDLHDPADPTSRWASGWRAPLGRA